jgi:Flp pilus assembly pilin Flp
MTRTRTRAQRLRRLGRDENGQASVEVILLAALVALALVWIVVEFPAAITKHYQENQKILASPL